MATVLDVITFARAQAQTDSNGLTDSKGILFANEALVDFHRQLVKHGVDASQIQEAYTNGTVATSGNGSTFAYPADCLALKSIEVNFTDTNPSNYIPALQIDVSNLAGQNSFSWLRINQSVLFPKFDDRGDWYEIFPAFTASHNLTSAIRLFYFLKPTEYTSTADTVVYPENIDYRILGWRVAANFFYALGKMGDGDFFDAKYQNRVKEYIDTLGRGSQQPLQATPIQVTGWEY